MVILIKFLNNKIYFWILKLDKPECKKCAKALQELENIDDEADQLGIGFVKINDEALAEEYNLGSLPALVYYRNQIPIIYERKLFLITQLYYYNKIFHLFKYIFFKLDELSREEDVLEWLITNKSTGDEEDIIEDVSSKTLKTLIGNIDNLVVLFCK